MEASGNELEQEGNRLGDLEYKKKLHVCLEPSLVSFGMPGTVKGTKSFWEPSK